MTGSGASVSVTVWVTPPEVAEMVTGVEAVTGEVVTRKLATMAPRGSVTLAGTEATLGLLLERLTPGVLQGRPLWR